MTKETDSFWQTPVFFHWQPAAWLRVSGEDAFTFLQGQFTNDLRLLERSGAVYGLWLNHKGRVLADSFILRETENAFWVGSYFCASDVIRERLEAFVIADDVVVEDVTRDWRGLTLFGPEELTVGLRTLAGVTVFAGRRSALAHREIVFPVSLESQVSSRLAGLTEVGGAEMELRRITDGIPAIPADIGPGELPNEGGLEAGAISYTKGCYLGQEVMARLKSMGQVRRRLVRVKGAGGAPVVPTALHQGDRRIGELRTAIAGPDGFVGLALLSLLHLRAGEGLSFSEGGEPVVKVSEPV